MLKKIVLLAAVTAGVLLSAAPKKSSMKGLMLKADPEKGIMTLMRPVAYNPKDARIAESVPVHYTEKTLFHERKDFVFRKGEKNEFVAQLSISGPDRKKMESGARFNVRILTIRPKLVPNPQKSIYAVTMTAQKRGFLLQDGKKVPFQVSRAYVIEKTAVSAMAPGFADTTVTGVQKDGGFEAETVYYWNMPDPAKTDDPKLPRVLVIADSISMNYNDSAAEFLKGSFNYHRIYGNSGDTRNGVTNLWHWLGPMETPQQKWDIVLVNHGLHDLKQEFDPQTKVFKDKHQVEPEDYRANFDRILSVLSRYPFRIIVATTTPVSNDQFNPGRKKDEDLKYNAVLLDVVKKYPKVRVLDLNRLVRTSPAFDEWKKGANVHFKPAESRVLGKAVADFIRETYAEKK